MRTDLKALLQTSTLIAGPFLLAGVCAAQALPSGGLWTARYDFGPCDQWDTTGFVSVSHDAYFNANPNQVCGGNGVDPSSFGFFSVQNPFVIGNPLGGGSAELSPEILHVAPASMLADGVGSTGEIHFRVDLPAPGLYNVKLYVGQPHDHIGTTPERVIEDVTVTINGLPFVDGTFARMSTQKAGFQGAWGNYRRLSLRVNSAGSDKLYFRFSNQEGGHTSLLGMEVLEVFEEPPILIDGKTNLPVPNPASTDNDVIQPALDELLKKKPNYETAWNLIDSITPANDGELLAVAWARATWIGWLRGEMDMGWRRIANGFREQEYLDDLEADLDQLVMNDPAYGDDPRVITLSEEMQMYRMGVLQGLTRGYTYDAADPTAFPNSRTFGPAPKDYVFDNILVADLCAGQAMLEQLDGQSLTKPGSAKRWPTPFAAKSKAWLVKFLYGRNFALVGLVPQLNLDFRPWNNYLVGLAEDLWPLLDPDNNALLYRDAHAARVMHWMLVEHSVVDNGNVVGLNLFPGLPPGNDYANAWWHDYIDVPFTSAPEWADSEYRFEKLARNLGQWWREERLYREGDFGGGELGGGDTDDVELIAGLRRLYQNKNEDVDDVGSRFVLGMLEDILRGPLTIVDQEEGYWYRLVDQFGDPLGIPDVEHASEPTTNPLAALMMSRWGDPRYVDLAAKLTSNIDESGGTGVDPVGNDSWTLELNGYPDHRAFRSWLFDARRAANNTTGTGIAKALIPTLYLARFNAHPLAEQYLLEIGRSWLEAARATGDSIGTTGTTKPAGIAPAGFSVSTGLLGSIFDPDGTGPQVGTQEWWYVNPNGGSLSYYATAIYGLMLEAALAEPNPSIRQGNLQMLQSGVAWLVGMVETDPLAGPGPATANGICDVNHANYDPYLCAVSKLRGPMTKFAFNNYGTFQSELNSLFDQASFDRLIELQLAGGSATTYLGILDQDPATVGMPKSLTPLSDKLRFGASVWGDLFPLASEYVLFTDRVRADGSALFQIQAATSGAPFSDVPEQPVSWIDASDGSLDMSDVSIVVTEYRGADTATHAAGIKALLYSHATQDAEIAMRVWDRLPTGTYDLKVRTDDIGTPDQIGDSYLPGFSGPISVMISEGEDRIPLPPLPSGVEVVLDLELVTASAVTRPLLDLAIDPEGVEVTFGGDQVDVEIFNVGTEDYVPLDHYYTNMHQPWSYPKVYLYRINAGSPPLFLGVGNIPAVDWSSDLQPRSAQAFITVLGAALTPGQEYEVVIEQFAEEITLENQRVRFVAP